MVLYKRPYFIKNYFVVNIYRLQSFDVLHLLIIKGLLDYLLDQQTRYVRLIKIKDKTAALLDTRFQVISKYTNLRRISSLSKKVQQTEENSRSLVRIIISIFISILIKINSDTLYIEQAIINFILLAGYRSYNDKILRYINIALARIDLLKEVFWIYRPLDTITDKDYFNFLKFYNISYLRETIRFLNLLDKYIT